MKEYHQPLSEQSNQPLCKWCSTPLEEYSPGHYCATFDPQEMWNFELTEEERAATEEAQALLNEWKTDCRIHGQCVDPEIYFARQSPRSLAISEHCFDRLLFGGGLVCLRCFDSYVDRKRGKETNLH